MLKSLEIVNREIIFYKEKIKEMKHRENIEDNEYYLYIKECLKEQEQIKQNLEIFQLIIKWKNMIHFKPDSEFLNDEEYNIMVSELKLIENYVKHHFGGYLPECFIKVDGN